VQDDFTAGVELHGHLWRGFGHGTQKASNAEAHRLSPTLGCLLNPAGVLPIEPSVAEIDTLVACSAADLMGPDKRLLGLAGEPVASLTDLASATALVARAGPAAPLPELVGALIASRPSGIVVLGTPDAGFRLALALRDGKIASAVGPEPLQSMGAWVVEFHRRSNRTRGRGGVGSLAALTRELDPARAYVGESVLQALDLCAQPGSTLLFLQGPHQWLHDTLPEAAALDFGFLLMEHARRADERPRVEAAIHDVGEAVVPVRAPGERPSSRVKPRAEGENDWDFFDDPDPAAESEWLDARYVYDFCDGVTSVEGLGDATMLGRFRTMSAVLALLEREHVALAGHAGTLDELDDLILELAS
jgi:hypothetical protein